MKLLTFALAPLALGLSLGASAASAETGQSSSAIPSTMLALTAEGKSTRTPDQAAFSAGVTSQGRTAAEAMSANAAAMNRVITALKRAGLADKDIQTSNLSLNPVYSQATVEANGRTLQEPRIVGYQASNTVNVRTADVTGFGKVLDTLVNAGANQINGPSFQLADPAAATDEARIAAMKAARARADLYARAAGLRVVRIVSISESGGYVPAQPMYARMAMVADSAPTPIAAGEVAMQVSVSVQFELAP